MIEVNKETATETAKKVKAGELPGPAKSLAEAVCRVMEQVSYIKKDKHMTSGAQYPYVSVEAVIDKLRPEMIKQQLVLLPVGVETMHQGDHGRQVHLRVKYTFDLIHAPSAQSKLVVVIGEGMDVGDKSSNKCMTAARKYALIMAFNIETGIDPDDTPSQQQERAPAKLPTDEEALAHWQARTAKAKTRDELANEWTAYDADVSAGKVPATARPAIVAVFAGAGKRISGQPAKA